MKKMEFRVQKLNLSTDNETLIVEGLVNKTETWSQMLGTVKRFKEKIVKGAFQRAINEAPYIDFLAEHDKTKVLATTSNDSLELFEDEEGLKMRARIAPTSYGKDFYTLIKERIVNHMSFGFSVTGQEFKRLKDGTYERTVTDLRLFEVSAVRQPAYLASAISARGIEMIEDVEIPDEVDNSTEEVDEERGFNEELLQGILEQLKVNNELLSSFKTNDSQTEKEEDEKPKEEPVEDKEEVEEVTEEKDLVVDSTDEDTEDSKEDSESEDSEKPIESDESESKEEVVEEVKTEEVVDLSAQKQILSEILEGEN